MATYGVRVVFGVPPELKELVDAPRGKLRFRFRSKEPASAIFKTPEGIRKFHIVDEVTHWRIDPNLEQGRNHRVKN